MSTIYHNYPHHTPINAKPYKIHIAGVSTQNNNPRIGVDQHGRTPVESNN